MNKYVTCQASRRPPEGFSLPELLVAVCLLGILSVIALPNFSDILSRSDFNAAVRQIASEARSARSLAVSKGGYYRLQTQDNSYRLEHSNSSNNWTSPDVISNWLDLPSLYGGVTIQSVSSADGAIFNSTGASIDSSNAPRSVSITLRKYDGTTQAIQVDPAGRVRTP